MALYIGTSPAAKLYVGDTPVLRVYHGDTQVWPAAANVVGVTPTSSSSASGGLSVVGVSGFAMSESDPEPGNDFSVTLQFDSDVTIPVPEWANAADVVLVGGGGGATGSNSLSWGVGGDGGTWSINQKQPIRVNQQLLSQIIANAGGGVTNRKLRISVGAGGAGGAYNTNALAGLLAGRNGGDTSVVLVVGSASGDLDINSWQASGGTGSTATTVIGLTQSTAQPGKAVTGGNSGGGINVSLTPPMIINGVSQTVYTGGGQAAAGSNGRAPGGGGAGKDAAVSAATGVGGSGGKGRAYVRFYSFEDGVTVANPFTNGSWPNSTFTSPFTLSPFVKTLYPRVLGAGGGGAGGTGSVGGEGGDGGQWNYVKTAGNAWSVDALLAAKGITRDNVSRLTMVPSVGRGGTGSAGVSVGLGTPGTSGGSTTLTLMCKTVAGVDVELARITAAGGAGGVNSVITSSTGGAVRGGNVNVSGTSDPGKDLRIVFEGKTFTDRGGSTATPGNPGRAPGGGGAGGTLGLGALLQPGTGGGNGADGAAYFTAFNG